MTLIWLAAIGLCVSLTRFEACCRLVMRTRCWGESLICSGDKAFQRENTPETPGRRSDDILIWATAMSQCDIWVYSVSRYTALFAFLVGWAGLGGVIAPAMIQISISR
ncbi:hypothetical protein GGR54DRAFT_594552 [Hypoxylon sp. NC1633]|nr:hypothetical protein GGR54DRAFT_594552 [Hypoxylon sp. NC1633]